MKLTEVHVALLQAGIPTAICDAAATAMVRDKHVASWTAYITSMQVAKLMWMSFACANETQIATESQHVAVNKNLPTQEGAESGQTILTFLSQVIKDVRMASNVFTLEIDSDTRITQVTMRDQAPIQFAMHGGMAQTHSYSLTIAGTFLSRTALAHSSRVWLPYDQQTIKHVK